MEIFYKAKKQCYLREEDGSCDEEVIVFRVVSSCEGFSVHFLTEHLTVGEPLAAVTFSARTQITLKCPLSYPKMKNANFEETVK